MTVVKPVWWGTIKKFGLISDSLKKMAVGQWHFQQGIGRIHAAAKGGGLIAMDLSYLFYPAQCRAFGSVWCEAG